MKQFNLDEYLANPTKKLTTRDGRPVRIICTDAKYYDYPIIALIEWEKVEEACDYTKDGYLNDGHITDYDLFFAPEKHEGWANIYLCDGEYSLDDVIYSSRIDAEESGKKFEDYLTTIQIEWEE